MQSEDKLPIQDSNGSLILPNNIQLLMRNIFRLLFSILLGAFAAIPAIALVIAHHRHRIFRMDKARNAGDALGL